MLASYTRVNRFKHSNFFCCKKSLQRIYRIHFGKNQIRPHNSLVVRVLYLHRRIQGRGMIGNSAGQPSTWTLPDHKEKCARQQNPFAMTDFGIIPEKTHNPDKTYKQKNDGKFHGSTCPLLFVV